MKSRRSAWWHRVDTTGFGAATFATFLGVSGIRGVNAVHGEIPTACGKVVPMNGAEGRERRPARGRFCRRCG